MAKYFKEEAFKLKKIPQNNPLFEVFKAGSFSYPYFMQNAEKLNKELHQIQNKENIDNNNQYNFSLEINKSILNNF